MWGGFGVPFLVGSLRALHRYFHWMPALQGRLILWVFRRTTPLHLRISFALLGYSYFMNTDVSLSIWLFAVIGIVVRGVMATFGLDHYDAVGAVSRFSSRGSELLAFVGMGYMLVLAFYSLWVARRHLSGVWPGCWVVRPGQTIPGR